MNRARSGTQESGLARSPAVSRTLPRWPLPRWPLPRWRGKAARVASWHSVGSSTDRFLEWPRVLISDVAASREHHPARRLEDFWRSWMPRASGSRETKPVAASRFSRYRLPGGRAPRAMPRPLTGGAGALPSPPPDDGGVSAVDSGCAAAGFGSAGAGSAGGVDFFAPGRLAPAAMPRPFTGAAAAGLGGAACAGAGGAASAEGAGAGAGGRRARTAGRFGPTG